jgi:small-conductance mechanosensitive channel
MFLSVLLNGQLAMGQTGPMDLIKNVLQPATESPDTVEAEVPATTSVSLSEMRKYQAELSRVNNMLRRKPDTTDVAEAIPRVEAFVDGVNDLLGKRETSTNLRMIGSILNFINFSERSLDNYQGELEGRMSTLSTAKHNIDSIKVILFNPKLLSAEQRQSAEYKTFVSSLKESIEITSEELDIQYDEILEFVSKIQLIKLNLNELGTQLRFESHRVANSIFSKEIPYFWQPLTAREPGHFRTVIKNAVFFNSAILFKYMTVFRLGSITFIVLIVLLMMWFTRTYRRTLADEKNREVILKRINYIPRFPRLSAALVMLSLLVLFYPDPPMVIFSAGLFLVGTITGILLYRRIQRPIFMVWSGFYLLFIFCLLSNLYWETVHEERYVIFFMSLSGIGLGLIYLRKLKPYKAGLPRYVEFMIWAYVVIEFIALVLNTMGRFSLSKMLSVTATVSLMQAMSLVVFVLIIKEFIYLQIELSNQKNVDLTSTNDYETLEKKLANIFSVVAISLWLYYFLKNLSIFDIIVEEIGLFLETPRSLHYATFSFGTILTFILTLYIANFIASNFAYFSEIRDRKYQGHRNKRFGSQILLVRLAIISLGFFIALAVAGIPMDRITIVLGALSVGIGFGLQNIINNLVSGVILAFERPIQIGDIIDSGPDQGMVKEIGIRSSKIRNWDGAEVVIPNGDLLANRLTNWTLDDKLRRIELIIGVSYKSDIDQVTELIRNSLDIEGVLKWPVPTVYLQKLNDNSLDFRVLFWVGEFELWLIARDQAMRNIYKSLTENGVQIPFPQRDLYIKSMPENMSFPGDARSKSESKKENGSETAPTEIPKQSAEENDDHT